MSLAHQSLFELHQDGDRLTFRCTRGATATTLLVLSAGVVFFGFPLVLAAWEGQLDGAGILGVAIIPIGILAVMFWIGFGWRVDHALDRTEGAYLRGGRFVCRLDEIADVIVIEQDPPDSGPTYEVYLARRDGDRIKLTPTLRPVSHKAEAESFARTVADFLGVEALGNFRADRGEISTGAQKSSS